MYCIRKVNDDYKMCIRDSNDLVHIRLRELVPKKESRQRQPPAVVGHALADHADGGPGHIPQGVAGAERPAGAAEQDLGNIVGLVAEMCIRDR